MRPLWKAFLDDTLINPVADEWRNRDWRDVHNPNFTSSTQWRMLAPEDRAIVDLAKQLVDADVPDFTLPPYTIAALLHRVPRGVAIKFMQSVLTLVVSND